ncbi:MAG: hypothetical protein SV422_06060, partial [Pseudomonadota bacterium]|nr:hypothetical protein [Pseudomonadota bacterium]
MSLPPGHARPLLPRLLLPCVLGMLAPLTFAQDGVQQDAQQAPQTWTVNFNGVDIRELIRFVADATGRTLIVDPLVQGTVEVVSS